MLFVYVIGVDTARYVNSLPTSYTIHTHSHICDAHTSYTLYLIQHSPSFQQTLAPKYEQLATAFVNDKDTVLIAKVDGSEEEELAKRYDISGFPTLLWFPPGMYML